VPRERLAAPPEDVTDPLLWRLALDVVASHQPDEGGNCRNLQCAGQRGICSAARTDRHAMGVARTRRSPAVTHEPERAHALRRRPGAVSRLVRYLACPARGCSEVGSTL